MNLAMVVAFRRSLMIIAACLAIAPARAEMTAVQRAEFETVIREYLLKHPELIEEINAKNAARRTASEANKRKAAVAAHAETIFRSPRQVTIGDPDGKVTMVEFFDYNCGFCKKALPNMLEVMKAEPKLRVVLKEFPVLGAASVDAAKVAVAVRMQDESGAKYLDFHQRLLAISGRADKSSALKAAREAGLDMRRLEQDLQSPEIDATLEENRKLAAALSIRGTPTYVIGDEIVPGAVPAATLKEKVQRGGR